jgi:hypothetical protein
MTFPRRNLVLATACLASLTASAVFAQDPDLTYHTVAPCIVVDTRTTGGAFVAGETRTYNVTGTGSLASQGGSATGCAIPGFSNNIPQVQAVALNIVAFQPTGVGNVQAYAADTTTTTSVVNMTASQNTANTAPVAVAQTPSVGDFKITVNISGSHVVISVVGYYSKAVQTVYVHPVPGDATASGTRLLNTLAAITNASATKRYVIKVEPGIYDVGATMLEMKPYVDIEGSGQEATVIQGNGNNESSMVATVEGADFAELRDLQVKSVGNPSGTPFTIATAIALDSDDTTIRNVTVTSSGASVNWGIRMAGSLSTIEEVNINVSGSGTIYGMVTDFFSAPTVRRTVINVTDAGTSGSKIGIWTEDGGCPAELIDVEINVSGGATAYGIQEASSNLSCTLTIRSSSISVSSSTAYGIYAGSALDTNVLNSTIGATGTSSSYGLYSPVGNSFLVKGSEIAGVTATVDAFNANIGGTMLDGGAANAATCAGVYDESYIFYASTCP